MAALELRARNEFDGASTVAGSEGAAARGSGGGGGSGGGKKRSRSEAAAPADGLNEEGVRDYDDVDPTDDDDYEYEDEDEDAASQAASGVDVVANAAFGGGGGGATARKKKKKEAVPRSARCGDCTTLSVTSDTDESVSVTSSAHRNAYRRAFPVTGVQCVGCALPAKVTPVDDFVRTSCDKMQEAALFKMAALIYQQKVADPARAEGVPVPQWPWKDLRAHYTMHRMDSKMQRYENMRTLAAMRKTLELQLLREDESTGDHVLDKGNAEQIMKIISLQSKEITLLHETTHAVKTGSSGQLPAGAASKRRGDQ
jgi:hypothetical protein